MWGRAGGRSGSPSVASAKKGNGTMLDVVTFGKELIETGDLDPLYIALWEAKIPEDKLKRWLIAYWCFYHAGLSCKIADFKSKNFFSAMFIVAYGGTRFPRGSERRHFRGDLAKTSVYDMRKRFGSGEAVVDFFAEGDLRAKAVMDRVTSLRGFGKWISWKVPDMLERLRIAPVVFAPSDAVYMFRSSLEGAEEAGKTAVEARKGPVEASRWLIRELRGLKAPPLYDRRIGVQETETVFCKWHSYRGGSYEVGKDTVEIRRGLVKYGRSKVAQRMIKTLTRLQKGLR